MRDITPEKVTVSGTQRCVFVHCRLHSKITLLSRDNLVAVRFQREPLAGEFFQLWKRRRNGIRALGNTRPRLHRVTDHRHGLPGVGRHDHRGLKSSGAHPALPSLRQSVHARVRKPQPLLSFPHIGDVLKGFSRADGHRIILRTDQIDAALAGKIQSQPRGNTFVSAFLRPLTAQRGDLYLRGQRTVHPLRPLPRCGILRRPLEVKDGAATGKQRGKLLALNLADLLVIGTDGENGKARSLAQLREIFRFAVQHCPADSRAHRCARHLRQRGPADRLEYNRIGTQFRSSLNGLQNLCALRNRIVLRVENLKVGSETPRSILRRGGLLQLVIVLAGGQRNEEAKLLHPVPFSCKAGSTFVPSSHRQEKEKLNRFNAVLFRESRCAVKFSTSEREGLHSDAVCGVQQGGRCTRGEESSPLLLGRSKLVALHFPVDAHEKIEMQAFGFEPGSKGFARVSAELDVHFSYKHVDENALGASRAAGLHSLCEGFTTLTGEAGQRVLSKVAWKHGKRASRWRKGMLWAISSSTS